MRTMATLTPLTVLLLLPMSAPCEERPRLADVLALQEAVHEAIDRAEPSIACILVSRSKKYEAQTPAEAKRPGRLGRFDLRRGSQRDEDDPAFQALRRLDLSDPNNVPESYGSGVVLDAKEGLILTLAHVVRNATKVYVRLPGGRGSWADIHASDTRSDLAVLRLIDRVPNLKALALGDGGKLRKGDFLLSLSNPFAAGVRDGSPSASWGIVSNLRRRATGALSDIPSRDRNTSLPFYCFNTLIQTDTRLNLGCSGGALLNLRGELVGLISARAGIAGGETPGGFGVPLDAGMRRIVEVLRRGEEVEYGFLGVYLASAENVPEGLVGITQLAPGGPAARAELLAPPHYPGPSDFGFKTIAYIVSIDGTPVHTNDDLFLTVGMHLAGSTVRVEIADKPDGPRRIRPVTLGKFPSLASGKIPSLDRSIVSKRPPARAGLYVDWTTTLAAPATPIAEGVVIREVLPGSAAARAQLRPGTIITEVAGRKVTNPKEFYHAMEQARDPIKLTLNINNRDEHVTLEATR